MSIHRRVTLALPVLAVVAACEAGPLPSSDTPPTMAAVRDATPPLTVFAQNVYVGTNVDAVLAAPADELPGAIAQALMTFMSTDWPARADVIAARIVAANSDVVALNELTILTVAGLEPLLPSVQVDFLPILLARLEARGGEYELAAVMAATDAKLSLGGGQVRLQDFDAVLVRRGIPYTVAASQQYVARANVSLGGLGAFDLVRGFVAVDVAPHGTLVRIVATHLEPLETAAELQAAQAAELIEWLDSNPMHTIVAGDLNSDPRNASPIAPYRQFMAAGFRDSWLDRTGPKDDPGFTCCHPEALSIATPTLDRRLDHVLLRATHPGRGATTVKLFGAVVADRTPDGLWPSDHAGVIASFTLPGHLGSAPR